MPSSTDYSFWSSLYFSFLLTSPKYDTFLCLMEFISFFLRLLRSSTFVTRSRNEILKIRRQTHIPKATNFLVVLCVGVHVFTLYRRTERTQHKEKVKKYSPQTPAGKNDQRLFRISGCSLKISNSVYINFKKYTSQVSLIFL